LRPRIAEQIRTTCAFMPPKDPEKQPALVDRGVLMGPATAGSCSAAINGRVIGLCPRGHLIGKHRRTAPVGANERCQPVTVVDLRKKH